VQGSFSDGGSPAQALHDNQDRIKLQNYFSILEAALHPHGRALPAVAGCESGERRVNGQFVFPDTTTYQNTPIDLQEV
jgi:hypothetical protein